MSVLGGRAHEAFGRRAGRGAEGRASSLSEQSASERRGGCHGEVRLDPNERGCEVGIECVRVREGQLSGKRTNDDDDGLICSVSAVRNRPARTSLGIISNN